MKLTFFLIAFCLIMLRVYFGSWHGGKDDVTITIENGDDYEQIKYGGKIILSDDETAIKSISPGGYIKYRKNSRRMRAESNLKGEIRYTLTDNGDLLPLTGKGRALVQQAISEMIAYGFDAKERMERLYKKGGNAALLNEIGNLKSPGVTGLYLNRLMAADSLSGNDESLLIKKVASLGSDHDKVVFLQNFKASLLTNPTIAQPYFNVVSSLSSDIDKVNVIKFYISQDTLLPANIDAVLDITGRLVSDIDKASTIQLLINGKSLAPNQLDKILDILARLGSDRDKVNMLTILLQKQDVSGVYFDRVIDIAAHLTADRDKDDFFRTLISTTTISEEKWISIIHATEMIAQDATKSSILTAIAQKMPLNQTIKAAYINAAKKINNDADYGKAIRALK